MESFLFTFNKKEQEKKKLEEKKTLINLSMKKSISFKELA